MPTTAEPEPATDEPANDAPDPEPTADNDAPAAGGMGTDGRSPALVVAIAGAVVLLAVSLGLLLFLVHEKSRADKLGTEQDDIAAVQRTAAEVAEKIARWNPATASADHDSLAALTNGPILSQYESTIKGLDASFPALGVTSVEATVEEVYVGQIQHDEAQVIVVADLDVKGQNPHTVPNHYLRVHLSRIGGVWKVDNVQDVNVSLAAGATAGSTTTTTVPAGDSSASSDTTTSTTAP